MSRGPAAQSSGDRSSSEEKQGLGPPLLSAVPSLAEGQSPFLACGILGKPRVFALHRG